MKGTGISANPPSSSNVNDYGQKTIIYSAYSGKIWGGSQPGRQINQIVENSKGYYSEYTYNGTRFIQQNIKYLAG